MFVAMSSSTLHMHRDLMALYAQRYGPETWVILYQADVRARREHLERMCRKALATETPGFKPEQPLEWCMRQVADDTAFWRCYLEEPAMLVLARASELNSVIDGEAPPQQHKRGLPADGLQSSHM